METLAGLEVRPLLLFETGEEVTCVLFPVDVALYKHNKTIYEIYCSWFH